MSTEDSITIDKITTSIFSHTSIFDYVLIGLIGLLILIYLNYDGIFFIYAILIVIINLVLKYYNQSIYIPNYKHTTNNIAWQAVLFVIGFILMLFMIRQTNDDLITKWKSIIFAYVILLCLFYLSLYHTPLIYKSLNDISYAFKDKDIQIGTTTNTQPELNDNISFYNQAFKAIYNFVNSKEGELKTFINGFTSDQQTNIHNRLIELATMLVRPVDDNPLNISTFSYKSFLTNFNTPTKGISYISSLLVIIISIWIMWPKNFTLNDKSDNPIYLFIILTVFYFIVIFASYGYKDSESIKSFDELLFSKGTGSYKLAGVIIGIGIAMSLLLATLNIIAYFICNIIGINGLYGIGVLQFIILWVLFTRQQTINTFIHDYYKSLSEDNNDVVTKPTHYDIYASSGKMTMYYILMIFFIISLSSSINKFLSLQYIKPKQIIELIIDLMSGLLGGSLVFMIIAFPQIMILINLIIGLIETLLKPVNSILLVDPFKVFSGQLLLQWLGL